MWRSVPIFLAAFAFAGGLAVAAPLEAYGGLPSINAVEISPDGASVAAILSDGAQRAIKVQSTVDGSSYTALVGEAKVQRLDWVGPDYLVITTSQTDFIPEVSEARREHMLGFGLNVKTHKMQPLLSGPPGGSTLTMIHDKDVGRVNASLNVVAGPPEVRTVDGTPTLFLPGISFPADRGVLTMFKVDLWSGAPHIADLGDRYTNGIVLDANGNPVARSTYNADSGHWTLRLRQRGGGWKESRAVEAKDDPPSLIGLGRDGRSVLVAEQGDRGLLLREVSPDGQWSEPIDAQDVDSPVFDPATRRLIGFHALVGDDDRYTFFDPADQKAWDAVRRAFKNDRVLLESWTNDRNKIVVLADSASEGPAYAMVDMVTHQAQWIGPRYGKLAAGDFAKARPVSFKAKDGLELTGYLTLPNGREAKDLPLIVFPHGGPASRDEPGFDWWAQAMASRGYAVLQVNFRGSDGFGWEFTKAGFGEWGRKMQTDLSDGVRHLAAQGVIDPKRVCIVGASYGGYAALAGAALDAGVYRCAASYAGISDLKRFVPWSRAQNGVSAQRYWINFMGAESARDPSLTQVSPAAYADKVSIPVLLIHGRDDTVVPLEQSRFMADAMKSAGKPVDFVTLDGTDHWLTRGDTRVSMLQAIMAFVEKHNPPH